MVGEACRKHDELLHVVSKNAPLQCPTANHSALPANFPNNDEVLGDITWPLFRFRPSYFVEMLPLTNIACIGLRLNGI